MVARPTQSPHTTSLIRKATTERLILVSNRGPVTHQLQDNGRIRRTDADGGVAVALASVARTQPVTWIASTSTFADRVVALTGKPVRIGEDSFVKLVNLPEDVYASFYQSFCNPVLWFVQHGIADHLRSDVRDIRRGWVDGYVPANEMFAASVIEELEENESTPVMLHDYHLYLAPRSIRDARPNAVLQLFVHIPWPEPETWDALPDDIVTSLCDGLLGNDSVVFQTENSVEAFMETCRVYLPEAEVCESRGKITYKGRVTAVWANPISVDTRELRELAASSEVECSSDELIVRGWLKTIVRVDRLDPSKNVLVGFEAYERMLETHPEFLGHVRFLSYLVPSRNGIPEYDENAQAVFDKVDAINARFGRRDWMPISLYYEQNRPQAFAGLQCYDVLLVNSIADGMNLVSKEGPIVNRRDGVLVLSKTAGSYDELRSGALCVDPLDVDETAEALAAALEMTPQERRRRAGLLVDAIESHELRDWLRHQTNDLAATQYVRTTAAAADL